MARAFRNVEGSPDDDPRSWPYEGLVAVMERGLVGDWQPIFEVIREDPWGAFAARVEAAAEATDDASVGRLFELALERARAGGGSGPRAPGEPSP